MTVFLVLLTLSVGVLVSWLLSRKRQGTAAEAGQVSAAMDPPHLPGGLFLDPGHAWLQLRADGGLRVGIDDFLAGAMGQISAVSLPRVGQKVRRGEPLFTLTAGGRTLSVGAPADGEVMGVNEKLRASPWLAGYDPYGAGWAVALWSRDQRAAIEPLRLGSEAVGYLRAEVSRLVELLTRQAGATAPLMADGALPQRGVLTQLSDAQWRAFARDFLGRAEAEDPAGDSQ